MVVTWLSSHKTVCGAGKDGREEIGIHNAVCKTRNGVLPTGAVPVAAEDGTVVCTEACGKDIYDVPPQAKDRCQSERDGVPAPLFLVKAT